MREVVSHQEQVANFDKPLNYALESFDTPKRSRNRVVGGKALGSLEASSYTEEQLDAQRALQESMDLRE